MLKCGVNCVGTRKTTQTVKWHSLFMFAFQSARAHDHRVGGQVNRCCIISRCYSLDFTSFLERQNHKSRWVDQNINYNNHQRHCVDASSNRKSNRRVFAVCDVTLRKRSRVSSHTKMLACCIIVGPLSIYTLDDLWKPKQSAGENSKWRKKKEFQSNLCWLASSRLFRVCFNLEEIS